MVTAERERQKEGDTPTPPPILKNAKTTSGRFPSKSRGLTKSKPKGGAPLGNRNALKTGCHTSQIRQLRRSVSEILRGSKDLLASLGSPPGKA